MIIESLRIENFQGIQHLDLRPTAPIVLIAGPNEAGKSSIQESIRLAVTGECVRVKLKKDWPALVHDGAELGSVSIEFSGGGWAKIAIPSGKHTFELDPHQRQAWPFVLDSHRFSGLSDSDRREFLLGLSGIAMGRDEVRARLIARGLDPDRIETILPLLRSGFPAAKDEAESRAKEARGAWKAITGTTYGVVKAETWQAPFAEPAESLEAKLQALEAEQAECAETIEKAQKQLGAIEEAARNQAVREKELAELHAKSALLDRARKKLEVDETDLASQLEKAEALRASAGNPHIEGYPCPHCGGMIAIHTKEINPHLSTTGLVVYEPGNRDPEAARNLETVEKAIAMLERTIANDHRDLEQAESAKAQLAKLETLAPQADPALSERILEDLERWKKEYSERGRRIAETRLNIRNAETAIENTAKARSYHDDVKAWTALSDALAPNGVPGEMITEALRPFNERLRHTADATGWDQVSIDPEMQIRVGGRLYGLMSESAKWRADAALTEAISHLSGLAFMTLDRLDVLDIHNRLTCLKWLHRISKEGVSAWVFGTFKALPSVPPTFNTVWMEKGRVTVGEAA